MIRFFRITVPVEIILIPPPSSPEFPAFPLVKVKPSIITADEPDISKQRDALLPSIIVLDAPFNDRRTKFLLLIDKFSVNVPSWTTSVSPLIPSIIAAEIVVKSPDPSIESPTHLLKDKVCIQQTN